MEITHTPGPRTVGQKLLTAFGLGDRERFAEPGLAESAGEGVCRFLPRGARVEDLEKSFALLEPIAPAGPVPAGWRTPAPRFASRPDGRLVARIEIEAGTDLYGTGEIAGPLRRNGKVTECWTTDEAGYQDHHSRLYQAHPWVLAVRADGTSFGVLADTTWRTEIDLRGAITFRSEGPAFQVLVIEGESPQAVVTKLADLTGHMSMPPIWSLGYHQCRFSYEPDTQVMEVAQGFRDRRIPCDVMWMDIDYMDRFRIFTFHPEKFPDPKGLNDHLHERGFKAVWMIDPGPAAESGYWVYEEGLEGDHFIRDESGQVYTGKVWPPKVAFPDYTRPETCEWWKGLYKDFMATGVDGVWNDMNEPAVIDGEMPLTNRHVGGGDLPAGPHSKYHNVYGMMMVAASREGIQRCAPDKRVFLLTRSNYIGGQRYAATWTGDNRSGWGDVHWSITMVLNLGLSGQPFAGPDLGGFIGDIDGERFARWFGFGTLLPFARGHTANDSHAKEPWTFDQATEETVRRSIERRYRLIPYLYTVAREAHRTGLPIARPVFFADPKDPALRDEDHAFLVGDDVLVLAKSEETATHEHAIPKGTWRAFDPIEHDDPNLSGLRVRGGAIVPMGPVVQHTGERPHERVDLVVCLDDSGSAEGFLYEDDGDGFAYQRGEFRLIRYRAETDSSGGTRVHGEVVDGTWGIPDRVRSVQLLKPDGSVQRSEGRDNSETVVTSV
ncbi:MAG: TIM-barrel domain-containing protein [Planctomycetota bacterium]